MKGSLRDRNVVLGITGGIAAYKCVELLRILQKRGAEVKVIMTENACRFIGKTTVEAISGFAVLTSLFENPQGRSIKHIEMAQTCDVAVIAPATANIVGKLASGIADDALSTFMTAVTSQKILCPAMNTHMYENARVQDNLKLLESDGYGIIEPAAGELACGTSGLGRLPEPEVIADEIAKALTPKDLKGKRILVSAGPTREFIDPVRFISNPSSGKMGFAAAKAADARGGDVTLVSGPSSLADLRGVNRINTVSAEEMAEAVLAEAPESDIIIMTAAVSDYRPVARVEHKIKKTENTASISLCRTRDILKELGKLKKNQILVGFAAETENLAVNAGKKLQEKNLDMVVGNIVGKPDSGFEADTGRAVIFLPDSEEELPLMTKEELAHVILDRVVRMNHHD